MSERNTGFVDEKNTEIIVGIKEVIELTSTEIRSLYSRNVIQYTESRVFQKNYSNPECFGMLGLIK